ncbi:unnamed protein product [Blepharisma stoltei]|uniref:Uncharacterized protein n=1 Tax=Blepharisma stoltei TaxID=1481888 RepID=A0AAU9JTM7_9CILI|nr:unnamed protein product [Blepharisma stoltei]
MILDLRVKIKENNAETIIKKLKQRIVLLEEELELMKEERDNGQKNYEILETKYKRALEKWEEEKDLIRYDKELSLQEVSQLKISLQEKENIIDENKDSIAFISKMLTQTNQMNNELNQKMQSLNEELDKANKNYHESQKSSKLAEGYEKHLEIYIEDITDKEKKIDRFNESVEAIIEVAIQIKNLKEEIAQKISNSESWEGKFPEEIKYLEFQKENISNIYEKLNASIIDYIEINAIASDKTIRSKLADLNADIKRQISIKEKYQTKYNNSKQEIIRLAASISSLKDLHKDEISKLKKIIDSNVILFEKLKNANHENKEKLIGKDLEIKKLENKIKVQNEKIDDFITQKEEFSLREEGLKLQLEHFKSKMMKLLEERRSADFDLSIRENNLEKSLWKIDSLKDELMKRENEIVKKNQKLILLETEMQRLKTNINKYIYHNRNIEGNLLGNYLKELATRDQKIEI